MKSTDMTDKERWATVSDPVEALKEMVQNSTYIGTDPYYRDLNDALWAMAERALKAHEVTCTAVCVEWWFKDAVSCLMFAVKVSDPENREEVLQAVIREREADIDGVTYGPDGTSSDGHRLEVMFTLAGDQFCLSDFRG